MAKRPRTAAEGGDRRHDPFEAPASARSPVPRIIATALESSPLREHFAAEAVLDRLNRGIVIFDQDRRVHFLNDSAVRQIHQSSSIAVVDDQLVFTDPGVQARLLAFLQRNHQGASDPASTALGSTVMRVAAGPGHAPYRVLLSSLRTPSDPSTGTHELRHVLMIYEPHAGQVVSRRILTELYGLSDAEAEVTLLLFRGETLETAAQHLAISINTAKTHLHHVFAKCEVHSQGELLQLLSLGPRTL
jgi:DNA-binding CsgD family transcriptional regulator